MSVFSAVNIRLSLPLLLLLSAVSCRVRGVFGTHRVGWLRSPKTPLAHASQMAVARGSWRSDYDLERSGIRQSPGRTPASGRLARPTSAGPSRPGERAFESRHPQNDFPAPRRTRRVRGDSRSAGRTMNRLLASQNKAAVPLKNTGERSPAPMAASERNDPDTVPKDSF